MVLISLPSSPERDAFTMARAEQQPRNDSRHTKLNKLRIHLEKGLIRPTNMDIHHLRKPYQLFNRSSRGHGRQHSLGEVTNISKNPSTSPVTPAHGQLIQQDINAVPEILTVSDFPTPTKSILSTDSNCVSSDPDDLPASPENRETSVSSSVPTISFTCDPSPTLSSSANETESLSRFRRLKMRTKSLFFEQDSSNNDPPKTPERPRLSKAHSDSKHFSAENTDSESYDDHLKPDTHEILRRRSRTLGSVENDLYQKRNGSLVKTIGSMVMLKPRQNTAESFYSSENSESGADLGPPPEVNDDDTPESYLKKLTEEGFESEISSILAEKNSSFMNNCFTLFLKQNFDFTDEPLDVSLRRFLLVCELPKESQQIDRVLSSFSSRYYECNPDLWDNPDQVYFLVFSLVMLQTDHFNPNNKKKMTKEEFLKNTKIDDKDLITNNRVLSKEVLECFYDNITYTKFIQKNKPTQPLYSLSRKLLSSVSSTNLEALNTPSQQLTNNSQNRSRSNTRSYSISSSTSQFFHNPQIDPYAMIMTDQVNTLRLSLNPVKTKNPFSNKLRNAFPDSYYNNLRKHLASRGGVYIRFYKQCNWLTGRTEIRFKEGEETIESNTRCLIKVIKIAQLNKEEHVKNAKFFPMSNATHAVWNECYGVLTTCGLFIFDNLNFLAIPQREKVLSGDYDENEPFIIDIVSDQVLRNCSKLSVNGLFACQAESEDTDISTFNIFSTNKKELFSTNTFSEMSSWIIAINYIAALDSCYIDFQNYHNSEIFSVRNVSIEDKIIRLSKNAMASAMEIDDLIRLQNHLRILTPFQQKTKGAIFSNYHSLEVRLDWLWYERERNQVYVDILRRELKNTDNMEIVSTQKGDTESLLEDWFFNLEVQSDENNISYDYGAQRGDDPDQSDVDNEDGDEYSSASEI